VSTLLLSMVIMTGPPSRACPLRQGDPPVRCRPIELIRRDASLAREKCAAALGQEWGRAGLRGFCLVEHVSKKRELIGPLLSRASRGCRPEAAASRVAFSLYPPASYSLQPIVYSLFLGTSASPIVTESFRHLADKILVPKRPPRISAAPACRGSDSSESAFRTCSQSAAGSRRRHSMSRIPLSS